MNSLHPEIHSVTVPTAFEQQAAAGHNHDSHWTRRGLISAGISVGGLLLAACGPGSTESHQSAPSPSEAHPTAVAKYPTHRVIATEFWVGETASEANAGIDNISTEWESNAQKYLGGYDNPDVRGNDCLPLFKPKENPYYFALPMSEFNDDGPIKGVREHSPWADEAKGLAGSESLFKGRWIAVSRPGSDKKAYGQWLDTGPSNDAEVAHDPKYVWGDGSVGPKHYKGITKGAGLDLSPSLACEVFGRSGQDVSGTVEWSFVDANDVPDGSWNKYPPIDNKTHWE